MENAGRRVVEVLEREFNPLERQRVLIFCGKGNNGGDGKVVARLLRDRGVRVDVILAEEPHAFWTPTPEMQEATIVVDALLGTGFRKPVEGTYQELIRSINEDFPLAKVVAVDIPSALEVNADITVTFGAPKLDLVTGEGVERAGTLIVVDIGVPVDLAHSDLELSEAHDFAGLFKPRKRDAHKGDFGHVLVIGGAAGKTGAAGMAGLAALRSGAGLVTVACSDHSRLAPELMTETLEKFTLERKTVLAVGPGLGPAKDLVARVLKEASVPTVIDADGLNSIAGTDFRGSGVQSILTPHPGEMARLIGKKVTDRLAVAQAFAQERNVCLVLKGHRTLIAFPDGRVWINPTGTPAMAKGGSGDILTGMIAGLIAQFPYDICTAVRAAVWLHGRAGEIGAAEVTEQCLIATDLLRYLPEAIRECARGDS
jgi:NAD(P)H-hydrate epimerase